MGSLKGWAEGLSEANQSLPFRHTETKSLYGGNREAIRLNTPLRLPLNGR